MRLAAVSAVASVVVLSAGSAALADPVSSTVTVGKNTKVVNTRIDPSVEQSTIISFLTVRIDGKKTPVYCAEFGTPLADNQTYLEGDSDKAGINKLGAISNLLAHAYPVVSADDLLAAADIAMPEPATDGHSMFDDAAFLAYVATQASVWELSNPDAFKLGDTFIDALNVNAGQYAVIVAVHKYLTKFYKAFKPELTITPASATATVGGKAGPFTVKTEGGKPDVTLTATGGKAVDSAGNEVTTAKDGDQFWITSDVVGSATVHGEATFKVPAARVLFFGDGDKHGQKLVMGGTKNKKLTADVTATFTAPSASPSPSPGLPVTGANVTGAAIGGAVLLLAGIGLVLVLRRRRVRFTA